MQSVDFVNFSNFNKNGPHWLLCWNYWFLAGGTVWKGLGSVALFEKVYQWDWALIYPRPMFLCLTLVVREARYQLLLQ